MSELSVWRNEEEVGVGDVLRRLSARGLVWGDVDPHCSGLCARTADGSTIVVEVHASALFESLGGWVEDAHACEIVRGLTVGQYVKQAEEVPPPVHSISSADEMLWTGGAWQRRRGSAGARGQGGGSGRADFAIHRLSTSTTGSAWRLQRRQALHTKGYMA